MSHAEDTPRLAAAERFRKVGKRAFRDAEEGLRLRLLAAQQALRAAPFPVLVVLAGDDRPACDETLNLLHDWMDPRQLEGNAYGAHSEDERRRPWFWRYWRDLPARGRIGVYLGAWTVATLRDRAERHLAQDAYERRLEHGRRFEEQLAADGALLLKFWLHLPADELRRRVRASRRPDSKDWQYTDAAHGALTTTGRGRRLVEDALARTHTAAAPWHVVPSAHDRTRTTAVVTTLLARLEAALAAPALAAAARAHRARPAPLRAPRGGGVLAHVDLSARVEPAHHRRRLREARARLHELSRRAHAARVGTVLAFEGFDAAGKGGTIRAVVPAFDGWRYRVVPIAAPTEEERAHHWLWRFWRHLPKSGHVTIYDRTWYGRVLVERVEGYAAPAAWRRAYDEITDFETQLAAAGVVLCKFWLHIDADEQLRRFRARQETPHKRWKITPDDWRNRERRPAYESAVDEMVARTSSAAPWHLVAANDKRHARLEVLRIIGDVLEEALARA